MDSWRSGLLRQSDQGDEPQQIDLLVIHLAKVLRAATILGGKDHLQAAWRVIQVSGLAKVNVSNPTPQAAKYTTNVMSAPKLQLCHASLVCYVMDLCHSHAFCIRWSAELYLQGLQLPLMLWGGTHHWHCNLFFYLKVDSQGLMQEW